MQSPDIQLSPERLLAIHQVVQEAKPPKGWRWLGYTLKGNMRGRLLPGLEDFCKIGEEIGLDTCESSLFGYSARLRLGEFIVGDFVDNRSVFWQRLIKTRVRVNADRVAEDVKEEISKVEIITSLVYAEKTNSADDIARRHLGLATRFGLVVAFILYQAEIDPQFALKVVSDWRKRIYQSRDMLGYIPLDPK